MASVVAARRLLSFYAFLAGTIVSHAAPLQGAVTTASGELVHYTYDVVANAVGTVILAQGSGCAPGYGNPNLEHLRNAFRTHSALIVEKHGIEPNSSYSETNCPALFVETYTLTQRVQHYRTVLNALDIPATDLILIGGSEGGLAMTKLAKEITPRSVVLFSSGLGTTFAEMVLMTVPEQGKQSVSAAFEAARENPESAEIFAGFSHRFWADILDYMPKEDMLAADTNFLVIQGTRDTLNPIDQARSLVSEFAMNENCHLTYWEFSALDHSLSDARGTSKLPEIAALAKSWTDVSKTLC